MTAGEPGEQPRILIVDDEPSLLTMMGVYLGRRGYTVTTTASTDHAAAIVEAEPRTYAAAVVDATMAGLSLGDLVGRLLSASGALCVLVSSGYPVEMSALEAAAPGRVAFLHKPFTPEMLAAAMRRLLGAEKENV